VAYPGATGTCDGHGRSNEHARVQASMMIADELRHRIARSDFRPGDALPSETDLTQELGYSK